jgi:hypothetical protein
VIEKFAKTGGELSKNVFLLSKSSLTLFPNLMQPITPGKSGIVTTAHGLRIACLGGTYDSSIYSSADAAPVLPYLSLVILDVHIASSYYV